MSGMATTGRSDSVAAFVKAAEAAFTECAVDYASRRSVTQCFDALSTPSATQPTPGTGQRRPACDHLDSVLSALMSSHSLARLLETFRAVEHAIVWRSRPGNGTASANFADGHANAMVLGPGGIEERGDVWLGASLLSPNVRYPDHDHAPEETYLVMSAGEFWHGESGWFTPGIGGSFHNVPGIDHAMRSGNAPLFVFWILLVRDSGQGTN